MVSDKQYNVTMVNDTNKVPAVQLDEIVLKKWQTRDNQKPGR